MSEFEQVCSDILNGALIGLIVLITPLVIWGMVYSFNHITGKVTNKINKKKETKKHEEPGNSQPGKADQ